LAALSYLVNEGVVDEEDGIVGGVFQGGERVLLVSTDQVVSGVVHNLVLNLSTAITYTIYMQARKIR
jgi:hypothetical protein